MMPAPLVYATVLLYFGAGLAASLAVVNRSFADLTAAAFLLAAAYLVANARSIGWFLGAATTAVQVGAPLVGMVVSAAGSFRISAVLPALVPLATFALLVHPSSRDFPRVWFT
jgi:hypothetical protein